MNQFDAGGFFIVKPSGKQVAVHQNVHALRFEILQIIEFQLLPRSLLKCRQTAALKVLKM
jgi:hypothetical protein